MIIRYGNISDKSYTISKKNKYLDYVFTERYKFKNSLLILESLK